MNEKVNYYDLLNIKMDATEEEIKRAYRLQIKKWHPDINKDPTAADITSKINAAKDILLDPIKRRDYDESLKHPQKEAYENLNKKQASRESSKQKSTQTTTNYDNYQQTETYDTSSEEQETKLYTKWEYFKLYLKYYNVPFIRKIFAVIFVLLESFLCFLMEAINIIIAYFIIYTYEILQEALLIAGCILYLLLAIKVVKVDPNLTTFKMVLYALGGTVSIGASAMLPLIVKILLQKNPIYISKLNMFLFKLSIGYK